MSYSIATWNVNSLRARLDHVCDWLSTHPVELLAIQETKTPDETFPEEPIKALGYHIYYCGQKAYNGVALISRTPLTSIIHALPQWNDLEKRFIAACTKDNILVVNVYVPNGRSLDSDKFNYKLTWLNQLKHYLEVAQRDFERIIVLGDFNIAPADIDVYDTQIWSDCLLVSPPEREALQAIQSLGFQDVFRAHSPNTPGFSWWDYRAGSFRRNHGLRIDLILATPALMKICTESQVDMTPRAWPKPSDHTPVWAEFDLDRA